MKSALSVPSSVQTREGRTVNKSEHSLPPGWRGLLQSERRKPPRRRLPPLPTTPTRQKKPHLNERQRGLHTTIKPVLLWQEFIIWRLWKYLTLINWGFQSPGARWEGAATCFHFVLFWVVGVESPPVRSLFALTARSPYCYISVCAFRQLIYWVTAESDQIKLLPLLSVIKAGRDHRALGRNWAIV